MQLFSILMFIAVGLAVAHVAHKTGEGRFGWLPALPLALAGALFGGGAAMTVGMSFYGLLGQMVVAMSCATLFILIYRQLRT